MAERKLTYKKEIFGNHSDVPQILQDECPWKQKEISAPWDYNDDIDDSNDVTDHTQTA